MNRKKILQSLKEFKKNNSEKYGIITLGIFGSLARGSDLEDSDIDIVIETSKVDLFMFVHLKEELETLFNSKVDIVRYRERMNQYLKKHIKREAIYV